MIFGIWDLSSFKISWFWNSPTTTVNQYNQRTFKHETPTGFRVQRILKGIFQDFNYNHRLVGIPEN